MTKVTTTMAERRTKEKKKKGITGIIIRIIGTIMLMTMTMMLIVITLLPLPLPLPLLLLLLLLLLPTLPPPSCYC